MGVGLDMTSSFSVDLTLTSTLASSRVKFWVLGTDTLGETTRLGEAGEYDMAIVITSSFD